jgi:hypothetical protein
LENIKEYLASHYGGTGVTLDYAIQVEATPTPEADDPADDYEMVDQNKTAHAPYSGRYFLNYSARSGTSCPASVVSILVFLHQACAANQEWMGGLHVSVRPFPWAEQYGQHC